ncbi:MAG: T9SS type A sorting domain-containing protein [Cytophagaceae bacterium]|nr:T9SS type A sorting domain-containing protein [Cytophagaceae bacterium]
MHKKVLLLFLLFITTTSIYAQDPADLCASAITLTPTLNCNFSTYNLPGSYVYDGLTPSCGTTTDDGWYKFTAQTTNYTFTLTGDYTHTAALYSGSCGSLVPIACNNAVAGSNASITFSTTPLAVYYIQVQRNTGTTTTTMTGSFSLCYASAPGGIKNTLNAWYKADGNLVKSGSTVTQWNTEVGNANFNNVFNAPLFNNTTANFNPAVVFGGNDYLNNPSVLGTDILSASDNTVFIVSKLNTGYSGVLLKWEESFPNDRFGFEGYPYPVATQIRVDHPSIPQQKIGGTTGSWNISTAATTNTTDNLLQDGLIVNTNTGGSNNVGLSGTLTIGGDNFSGFHSNSLISEVIFYGTTLSALEHQKVQSYLAVKYGITLGNNSSGIDYYASNGTVIWPQNSTDQNDIAGIGRDDASGLSQLKSKSANSDDIITMALVDAGGSFSTPNKFDNTLEFELWGNDNGGQPYTTLGGGLLETTVECPVSILKRLARQWNVVETGTVGDVALAFDLSSITVTGTTYYDFRLLIDLDKDGDFTTGTVKRITPSSYAGNIVTFNNVDFNNGEIFTLATLVPAPGGISSGLQIWLRASEMTSTQTNNAQLNSWYNAGSSNFDFNRIIGSTAGWPRFRTQTMNFNHSVEFSNSAALISQNNAINMRPTTNNSTSMVVFQTTQSAGTTDFWASPNFVTTESYFTGRDYGFGIPNGKIGLKIKDGEPWDVYSNTTYNDNVIHLASASRTRSGIVTNPSTVSIQVDGFTDVTATSAGDSYALDASDAFGVSFKGTGIGGNTINGFNVYNSMQYIGTMGEVIVFNNTLTGVNLNKVNSYLAIKFGITLGCNTTPISYLNSSAAVIWNASATHQNDIVAIGRDDRSQLNQRRSISVNTDNMTDIALVDNGGTQAAPNDFNNDKEFFIIGNNDSVRAFGTADVDGAIIINRLRRVWKVQETGTVGNVVLAVDLSAIPTALSGSALRLLVDRDNDGFADNDVTPQAPDSYNAGTKTVYFTTDLSNGDLFTVGTAFDPLPVEFIGIKAFAETDENKITWQTATEINNSHFVVERLIHGNEWDSIGTVKGANNSNTLHNYEFLDDKINTLTFAYYRVVQYDYDGKSKASKIVYLDRTSFTNTNNLIKVGPNPADRYIDIVINNELFNTNSYRIEITSVLGVNVYTAELPQATTRIDLSSLSSGNYIIELMNSAGASPVYEKIIIRHQ